MNVCSVSSVISLPSLQVPLIIKIKPYEQNILQGCTIKCSSPCYQNKVSLGLVPRAIRSITIFEVKLENYSK